MNTHAPYTIDRHVGFRAALAKRGLSAPPEAAVEVESEPQAPGYFEEVRARLRVALDRFKPTALCCSSSNVAGAAVLPELRRRGLAVGRDLAVATFDEVPETEPEKPFIHEAVQVPCLELGVLAQWTFEAFIRGGRGRPRVLLPPVLKFKQPEQALANARATTCA